MVPPGDMTEDDDDAVIVRLTIELGHNLGMKVVAEGVETEEIWSQLAALGCDEAQGYHLSRPLAAAEMTRWLTERGRAADAAPRMYLVHGDEAAGLA